MLNRLTKPHLNCLHDQSFEELLFDFFVAINFPYFSIRHVLYLKWSQKLPFNLKVMNTTNSLQVNTLEVGCALLGLMVIFVAFCGNIFGYVYGVASQKRYIGQVHHFGALCTALNSVHWCTEFSAKVYRTRCTKCTEFGALILSL